MQDLKIGSKEERGRKRIQLLPLLYICSSLTSSKKGRRMRGKQMKRLEGKGSDCSNCEENDYWVIVDTKNIVKLAMMYKETEIYVKIDGEWGIYGQLLELIGPDSCQ